MEATTSPAAVKPASYAEAARVARLAQRIAVDAELEAWADAMADRFSGVEGGGPAPCPCPACDDDRYYEGWADGVAPADGPSDEDREWHARRNEGGCDPDGWCPVGTEALTLSVDEYFDGMAEGYLPIR